MTRAGMIVAMMALLTLSLVAPFAGAVQAEDKVDVLKMFQDKQVTFSADKSTLVSKSGKVVARATGETWKGKPVYADVANTKRFCICVKYEVTCQVNGNESTICVKKCIGTSCD